MNTPHKHAELIKAWADGAEIEYRNAEGEWYEARGPAWGPETQYRIKPERVYPKSSLTYGELFNTFSHSATDGAGLTRVADAAVRQYILDTEAGK